MSKQLFGIIWPISKRKPEKEKIILLLSQSVYQLCYNINSIIFGGKIVMERVVGIDINAAINILREGRKTDESEEIRANIELIKHGG